MKVQSTGRSWMRRLFQLSLLMMVVPVYFLYQQLRPGSPEVGEDRLLLDQVVGLWQVTLVEQYSEAPSGAGFRDYELKICETCTDTFKAAFIATDRPTATEYGEIFSGGPAVFHSRLSFLGTDESKPSKVWLTLEGWDGNVWQVSVP